MTFLYDDATFNKLIIESKIAEQIIKNAQQAETNAKLIATRLANILATQFVQEGPKTGSQLYVQDLVSLDSFLNFLMKNEERHDGELIVSHNATTADIQPPKPELYTKYKDFFVLKTGLMDRLRELDAASRQAGNEVMKPLLKGLILEANKNLGLGFESAYDNLPANPYDKDRGQQGQGGAKVQVPFAMDESTADPNYKNVSQQENSNKAMMQKDMEQLKNVLPLQSTSSISPYDITSFIHEIANLIKKHPNLAVGPMLSQMQQFNNDISRLYGDWQMFVEQATTIAPNARSAREDVPYDLAGRPISGLEMLFGSTPNAKAAAARLLQMLKLVEQTIISINRSPVITNLLGQDILSGQLARAKAFIDSLGPFARW